MRHPFRALLAFIFFLSTLIQANPAFAAGFGQRAANQLRPFEASDIRFIAEFSSYLKYTLAHQGLELKKKIYCLGYEEMSSFYLLGSEDLELSEWARQSLDQYKTSVECQTFLEEVESINRTFLDMRVMLGLHQAWDNEIMSKLVNSTSGFGSRLTNPEHIFLCNQLVQPLQVEETQFCLSDLISIVNIFPRHIITTDSALPLVDFLLKNDETPNVATLSPLTWNETVLAALKFQEKYIGGEFTDYLLDRQPVPEFQTPWEKDDFYAENPMERNIERYGIPFLRYSEARDFQAQGNRYFSEYPEESAPTKYIESLSKYPFLIFLEPEKTETSIDCETDRLANSSLNVKNLCNRYLEALETRGVQPFNHEITKESVAKALRVSLNLNNNLLLGIEEKYPLSILYDESNQLKQSVGYHSLADWSELMKMENVKTQLFTLYPDLDGSEARFVEIFDRREFNWMVLSLVGAVGFGLSCSFIGNIWGLAACLAASGAGVNMAFYAQAYNKYEDNFGMFFARDVTDQGDLMTLLEFSKLNRSLQDVYLEAIFLGIGTGAGDILSRVIKRIR